MIGNLRRDYAGLRLPLAAIVIALLCGCAREDRQHVMVISVPDQRMVLYKDGDPVKAYPVSTSKFGLGDRPGSMATPLGLLKVKHKIGTNAPAGAVFKGRRLTGEVLAIDAPGRDPIVTRILWLDGQESRNRRSFARYIYIHGTPEERTIGTPASYGCVRMRSRDIIELYEIVGVGARVKIVTESLLPPPPVAIPPPPEGSPPPPVPLQP